MTRVSIPTWKVQNKFSSRRWNRVAPELFTLSSTRAVVRGDLRTTYRGRERRREVQKGSMREHERKMRKEEAPRRYKGCCVPGEPRTQDLFSIPPPSRPLVSPNIIFRNEVNLDGKREEVRRKLFRTRINIY